MATWSQLYPHGDIQIIQPQLDAVCPVDTVLEGLLCKGTTTPPPPYLPAAHSGHWAAWRRPGAGSVPFATVMGCGQCRLVVVP